AVRPGGRREDAAAALGGEEAHGGGPHLPGLRQGARARAERPPLLAVLGEGSAGPAARAGPDVLGLRGGARAAVPGLTPSVPELPPRPAGGGTGPQGGVAAVGHHLPGAGLLGADGQQGGGAPLEGGPERHLPPVEPAVVPAV